MKEVVADLAKKNHLEEDEGRKIMWAEGIQVPLTVIKSDGGFTYDTSDMAAIKQRVEEEAADWLVYVTDAGQATHFQSVIACAQKAGYFKPGSGDTVRLVELLDEGLTRSKEKLLEKEREK